MKLLVILVDDPVDLTPFPKGTEVTVTHHTTSIPGVVMFPADMLELPMPTFDARVTPIEG